MCVRIPIVYVPQSAASHHHTECFLPTRYQLRCLMSNDSTYCSAGLISVSFLFRASGNLTAKQVWVVCAVSRMKSRTALVTIAGLLHLQLPTISEAIKKPYVETYWESWIPGVSPQICSTKKPKSVQWCASRRSEEEKYRFISFNCFNFSGLPKWLWGLPQRCSSGTSWVLYWGKFCHFKVTVWSPSQRRQMLWTLRLGTTAVGSLVRRPRRRWWETALLQSTPRFGPPCPQIHQVFQNFSNINLLLLTDYSLTWCPLSKGGLGLGGAFYTPFSTVHFQPNGVLYFPKGGLVKIALGGALFSMGQHVTSPDDALHFAEQMQAGLRMILLNIDFKKKRRRKHKKTTNNKQK